MILYQGHFIARHILNFITTYFLIIIVLQVWNHQDKGERGYLGDTEVWGWTGGVEEGPTPHLPAVSVSYGLTIVRLVCTVHGTRNRAIVYNYCCFWSQHNDLAPREVQYSLSWRQSIYCRLANNHDCFNFTMFAVCHFPAKLNPL